MTWRDALLAASTEAERCAVARAARANGIRVRDIAGLLNVSASTVHRWTGDMRPSLDDEAAALTADGYRKTLERIASAESGIWGVYARRALYPTKEIAA